MKVALEGSLTVSVPVMVTLDTSETWVPNHLEAALQDQDDEFLDEVFSDMLDGVDYEFYKSWPDSLAPMAGHIVLGPNEGEFKDCELFGAEEV